MKTILRNFISVLRRFKMATILNILGLSVAFAAFMVIMMQVDYDKNFDTFHKNADNIYRVELQWDKSSTQVVLSRPLCNVFTDFSPHILAGAVTIPFYNETFYGIDRGGFRYLYGTDYCCRSFFHGCIRFRNAGRLGRNPERTG